jgi:hypothetical protein
MLWYNEIAYPLKVSILFAFASGSYLLYRNLRYNPAWETDRNIRKSQEKGNQRKNAQAYNEHSLRAFLMKTRQAREEKLAN